MRTARLDLYCAPLRPDLQSALFEAWRAPALEAEPRVLLVPQRALGRFLLHEHTRVHGFTAGIRTVSVADLAFELTAAERLPQGRRAVGPDAQTWLVRQLRQRVARPATSLDGALEVRGFRAALQRVFDDLAHAGLVTRRDLERVLVQHGFDLPLPVRHVLELALAYRASFEGTHDDTAAVIAQAGGTAPGRFAAVFGARRLDVYGFTAAGALERRMLEALCRDPELELTAYVPRLEADPPLAAWARTQGAAPRTPAVGTPPPAALLIIAAPSEESEADEVARCVWTAASQGMAFDTMAVIARHARRLDLVRAALARAGIPSRLHPGPALQSTRTGRAVLAFFDVLENELRAEPVLGFFAVAPLHAEAWTGVAAGAVPSAWERVAREACVARGFADWQTKLTRHAEDLDAQAARLEAESEPAQRARAAAQAARELQAAVTVLERDRKSMPQRGRWSDFAGATTAWIDRALAPGPERDAVRLAVDRLQHLDGLGRVQPTRGDFRDAVRGTLADSVLPGDGDAGVWLGTAQSLWGATFELVALVGLREGEWPATLHDDPVLPDRFRRLLGEQLGDRDVLPGRAEAVARDHDTFAHWCRAAAQRLVLSWARMDPVNGAACLPSVLLLDAASAHAGRPLDYQQLLELDIVERVPLRRAGQHAGVPPLDGAELDAWIAAALPPVAARRYVLQRGGSAARGLALDRLRQRMPRFTSVDGWLGGTAARTALAGRVAGRSLSATQLAVYATCPFRYFMRYVLRLEPLEREDPHELSELESGRLVHTILERFHRELLRDGLVLPELDDAAAHGRLLACIATVCGELETKGRTGARLLWDVRRQRLRDDLWQAVRDERRRAGRWRPQSFELRFGRGAEFTPRLDVAGGSVGLHGFIDRIDVDPATRGVCVIDYKTGRAITGKSAARAVQLVVYLHAVTAGDPGRLAASEGRFVHVTRRGGFVTQRLPGRALVDRDGDLAAFVRGAVSGMASGAFFPAPGPGAQRCQSCDYQSTCDARIAALAELKGAAGQTRPWEALPEFASLLQREASAGAAPEEDEPGEGEDA